MTTQTILWIILAAVVAFGFSMFQYYFKARKKSKHRIWLCALRFVAWFALLLLLINPKFAQKSFSIEKPSLIVAVDNSSSIAHFGQEREVMDFISNFESNEDIENRFDLDVYSFGENLRTTDSLTFEEKQTKIGEALRNLQEIYQGKNSAVLLITDGNQTFGQDYRYLPKNDAFKVYPIVVGDTAQYMDLKISRLNVNRYAFLNNKFPVEIFVNYSGENKVNTELLLKQGAQVVFRKQLDFSPQKKSERITAILSAERVGVRTYTAIVQPLGNEKNKSNNQEQFALEVIDEKTEVLLLAGILHPDVGAIKKAVESNEQRSVTIKTATEDFDLGAYQLVVLYQPNSEFEEIYKEVERLKINTFTITGTATDYAFLNRIQTGFHKKPSNQTEEYFPMFNENYGAFQIEEIGFDDFPPLKDQFGGVAFDGQAQTMLFQNIQGMATENPLLVTMEEKNAQRKAYLFGEGIWKWRAKTYMDSRSFEDFDELIGKLVQYLASTEKRNRLELEYNSFYNKGDQLVIEASYFDRNYVFDPRAKLIFRAKNKETEEIIQRPFLLNNTNYRVNLSDFPPGDYAFTVSVENQNLSESGEFTLVDFDMEKQFMNASLDQLQQIANNQNDQVYFLDQNEMLMTGLLQNETFKPVQKSTEKTVSLIDWYYLLIAIILALSLEWFIRKYYGLI